MSQGNDVADRELVIVREFAAPRELVWRAWTEPAHVARWFGPRGFNTTVSGSDLRPGGQWRYVMHGPDGSEFPFGGVFREVVPFEKIVSTNEFEGDYKTKMPGVDLPRGTVVTTLFDDLDDATRVTIRVLHVTPEDKAKHEAMGVVAGWNSSFECLDEHLASLPAESPQPPMIFVNLPVADLPRAVAFYTAIGFKVDPQFSDDIAAGMVLSDIIHVMLLTHDKFREVIPKRICDAPETYKVASCVSCPTRGHVDATVRNAVAAGGETFEEPTDHGFMYQHGFLDPDGHGWSLIHLNCVPPA